MSLCIDLLFSQFKKKKKLKKKNSINISKKNDSFFFFLRKRRFKVGHAAKRYVTDILLFLGNHHP